MRVPKWREFNNEAETNLAFLRFYERKKFVACFFVVAECSQHGAGHGLAVLFLYAAHLHAKVTRFDDDAHALRRNFLFNRLRDLAAHALLNLKSPRKHVYQARDLAESQHSFV